LLAPLSQQDLQIEPGNKFRGNLRKPLKQQAITIISYSKIVSGRGIHFSADFVPP
jgi:hypothetical protein